MEIKIGPLYALVCIDTIDKIDKKFVVKVYPKIFTNKEEAEKLAKEFGMQVKNVFINDEK
jgi:dihydroxyacetone kinase